MMSWMTSWFASKKGWLSLLFAVGVAAGGGPAIGRGAEGGGGAAGRAGMGGVRRPTGGGGGGGAGAGGVAQARALESLQRDYVDLRFGMFLHFGILTYTGSWAKPNLPIKMFNPIHLNPGQWADAAE